MASNVRSAYYFTLDEIAKTRYEEKLAVLGLSVDPLSLKESDFDGTGNIKLWPKVTYPHVFCYLINYPSIYTHTGLKAYKSLESYKYVLSGLVYDVKIKTINKNYLVVGRVRHGQSMVTKTPLYSWLGIQEDFDILNGHCTCMAGLGEVCSHVSALMFYLMCTNEYRMRKLTESCTSEECVWLPPCLKEVTFAPLSEINFKAPEKREIGCQNTKLTTTSYFKSKIPTPSLNEQQEFFQQLADTGIESAVLRIIPPFCENLTPIVSKLGKSIFKFHEQKYEKLLYNELIERCVETFLNLNITGEEVSLIEKHTKEQSKSNLWF